MDYSIYIRLESFVIKNGRKGFTNKDIKTCFKDEWNSDWDQEWGRFKASARRAFNKGKEAMFYEDGKYFY